MKKGRILLVDNDVDVVKSWKRRLELEGYLVLTAASRNEAKELVQTKRVHLAVIDMRLQPHGDQKDTSGLLLANELDPLIVKVILTGFPDTETMSEAMGPQLDGLPRAFNYISKNDPPSKLVETVKVAFAKIVRINFGLKARLTDKHPSTGTLTYLEDEKAFEYLLKEIRDRSIGDIRKEEASEELSEVFAKLFYSSDEITMSPISTKRGYSKAAVFLVKPSSKKKGAGATVIVKFGTRRIIAVEARNYAEYAKPFLQFRTTAVGDPAYTKSFGGMIYTLVGTNTEDIRDFMDCYSENEHLAVKALGHLVKRTCKLWYENKSRIQELSLSRLYKEQIELSSYEELERAFKDVFPEYDGKLTIELPGLEKSIINPVIWLKHRKFPIRSYLCITHGDLNGKNILVDENGYPWVIDFFRTGWGHVLRDFVELEADIKFNCLESSDMEALYEFESSLTSPKKFDDSYKFENKRNIDELAKAFNVIRELRTLAHSVVEPGNDITEYYVGLLYHTINKIKYQNITKERKKHALLSASLICEKLEKWK